MIASEKYESSLNLKAGRLCLDFANTADWHASDHPAELLNSYPDLVSWAEQVGILTVNEAQQLLHQAAHRPTDAATVLEQAISFREALYRIFSTVAGGGAAEAADLAILNDALSVASGQLQIVSTTDGFVWGWTANEDVLDKMLWPVARSAADLLTSEELNRLGECADDRGCGWLFLDMSRNHSRRWCDMRDCGNRAKARRHYERKRAVGK